VSNPTQTHWVTDNISERPNGSASDRNGHRGACRHPLEIEALIAATSEGYNFPRSFWKQTWEGKVGEARDGNVWTT
jgi:hypothetical protein